MRNLSRFLFDDLDDLTFEDSRSSRFSFTDDDVAELAFEEVEKGFDPNQPRDEEGKWTDALWDSKATRDSFTNEQKAVYDRLLEIVPKLSERRWQATTVYSEHGHTVNKWLRTGKGSEWVNEEYLGTTREKFIAELDAFSKSFRVPEDVLVFRGVKGAGRLEIGQEFTDQGFGSTSFSLESAEWFTTANRAQVLAIKVPKGTRAGLFGERGAPSNERELMLPRGTRYKVTGEEIIPPWRIGVPKGRFLAVEVIK